MKTCPNFGVQVRYNENKEFALHVRMICALAFISPHHVTEAFEELNHAIRNNYDDALGELLLYFEKTYTYFG